MFKKNRSTFSEMADLCMARGQVLQQDCAREHALDPCTDPDRQMHEGQTQPALLSLLFIPCPFPSLWFHHTVGNLINPVRHTRDDKAFGYF